MKRTNKTYYLHISIPFCYVADYMNDEDFREYDGLWDNIGIELHFEYTRACPEVGIREGMRYLQRWSVPLVGNYPDAVKDAVDDYLKDIDVEAVFEEQALENAY